MIDKQIAEMIVLDNGIDNQIKKCVEELCELSSALMKNDSDLHICEEMADVYIMLEQLKVIMEKKLLGQNVGNILSNFTRAKMKRLGYD